MNPVLFKHFKTANDGYYIFKYMFYQLKEKVLKSEGEYLGFFVDNKNNYKMYSVNDEVFHFPTAFKPAFGDRISNICKESSGGFHTAEERNISLLTLFFHYDQQMFNDLLRMNPSARYYWQLHERFIRSELSKIKEVSNAA